MGERRTEKRLLCADMVHVEWTDLNDTYHRENALLEDISPLGICLQLESALPEFGVVVVNLKGTKVRAMVRYCRWREIGYFAGLTFAPGSRWSRERYEPQHLTDPLVLASADPAVIV